MNVTPIRGMGGEGALGSKPTHLSESMKMLTSAGAMLKGRDTGTSWHPPHLVVATCAGRSCVGGTPHRAPGRGRARLHEGRPPGQLAGSPGQAWGPRGQPHEGAKE